MKKLIFFLLSLVFLGTMNISYAKLSENPELDLGKFFTVYFHVLGQNLNQDYKDIVLLQEDIEPNSSLYTALQKGVYMGYFSNKNINFDFSRSIDQKVMSMYLELTTQRKYDRNPGNIDFLRTMQAINTLQGPIYKEGVNTNVFDRVKLSAIYEILKEDYLYPEQLSYYQNYPSTEEFYESLDDDYTDYFNPEEASSFVSAIEGDYIGIGIKIIISDDNEVFIEDIFLDTPAYGILEIGDQIIRINSYEVVSYSSAETILTHLQGDQGTSLIVEIIRDEKVHTFSIIREAIELADVEAYVLENNTCYIPIYTFSTSLYDDFVYYLEQFSNEECDKYVLDLRNNLGGELYGAIFMAEHFIPDGIDIFTIEGIDDEEVYKSGNAGESIPDLSKENIIILINEYSASASEVLAQIIKDYSEHAIILGTTSYGKGSIQMWYQYKDGSGFKYTYATWYTKSPAGSINHKGITPDIILEDNPSTPEDEVLEYAIDFEF